MDAKYNSTLRTLFVDNFSREYFWDNEDAIEHALDVMTDKQAGRMYALLKSNNKQEVEQFLKELQSYQIRRTV